MDMNFDVNKVFQERLASSMGLDKYQFIMDTVKNVDVSADDDFQRTFNGFYIVRRNESWQKIYYDYFESVKNASPRFEDILIHLYQSTGYIEPSFSSKMLATIYPNKPIWDRYVLTNLGFKLVGRNKDEKVRNAVALYAKIEEWYSEFLKTEKAQECIKAFNNVLPNYMSISSVKKIDSIIWSIR